MLTFQHRRGQRVQTNTESSFFCTGFGFWIPSWERVPAVIFPWPVRRITSSHLLSALPPLLHLQQNTLCLVLWNLLCLRQPLHQTVNWRQEQGYVRALCYLWHETVSSFNRSCDLYSHKIQANNFLFPWIIIMHSHGWLIDSFIHLFVH